MHNPSDIVSQPKAKAFSLVAAIAVYTGFAIYLYYHHLPGPGQVRLRDFFLFNTTLAAAGAFLLCKRWVRPWLACLLGGAVYGFGPYVLGLAGYHMAAAMPAAMVPWMLLPAAMVSKKYRLLAWPVALLPFVAIVAFFQITSHFKLFVMPLQDKLAGADFWAMVAPLARFEHSGFSAGFYHVPPAAILMGLFMLFASRRYGIILLLAAGAIFSTARPLLDVSPLIWFSITAACCSVLAAAGLEGFVYSGPSDRKYILIVASILLVAAGVSMAFAARMADVFAGLGRGYEKLFVSGTLAYLVSVVIIAGIFLMTKAHVRMKWFRWALLGGAMAADIFVGAEFIVDRLF